MGLSAIASRLIANYGEAGVFERPTETEESTYPPTVGGSTFHPATVAVVSYELGDRDGSNIQVNHLRALTSIEGLGIEPSNGDKLAVAGQSYSILNVERITRRGVALFYDIQVVRS